MPKGWLVSHVNCNEHTERQSGIVVIRNIWAVKKTGLGVKIKGNKYEWSKLYEVRFGVEGLTPDTEANTWKVFQYFNTIKN